MANRRIVDYASLCTAVAEFVDRSDLSAAVPDFVALAEERMNRTLRIADMLVIAQAEVDNATYGNGQFFPLPADFLELKGQPQIIPALGVTSSYTPIEYLAPDQLDAQLAAIASGLQLSTNTPRFYTITGVGAGTGTVTGLGPSPALAIAPIPADGLAIQITYYASLQPLSDEVTTNWLLLKWPSAYLFGALAETAPYLRDDDRVQLWQGKFETAINEVQAATDRMQWAGGPIKGQRKPIL